MPRWLAMLLMVFGGTTSAMAQNLGYAKEPTITEYDVDPSWPQRPEHVTSKGWVSGLAVDAKDQVWFFQKGPDPVQVYTADGVFVRTWGRDQFVQPHHLRIGPKGNVWLADFGLHVVQEFTPEGKLLRTIGVRGEQGEDETHLNKPTDMAITAAGDIFITDGYGSVALFTSTRTVSSSRHGASTARGLVSLFCHTPSRSTPGDSFTSPIATVVVSRSSIRRGSFWISGRT